MFIVFILVSPVHLAKSLLLIPVIGIRDRYLIMDNCSSLKTDKENSDGEGGVVDIACGTGAVLLYLAERGIDINGTDLSEEMCKVAASKAEKMNLNLNIYPADMTKFNSGRKYSLAIIARSGFMHLPTSQL